MASRYSPAAAVHVGPPSRGAEPPYNASNPNDVVPGLSPQSPWNQKGMALKYPPLTEDISADVVLVGAGIAGLTCAYNLVKEGKNVVVLENRVRGGGQTGRTTAHLMTWLDDYYYNAISMHGTEKASLVASSLRSAVDMIEQNVVSENIQCKFTRLDGILYPHSPSEIKKLEKERDAALKCGLSDTNLINLGGGADVGGIREALVFPRNADFHPLMYLEGLVDAITKRGGRIYEGTKAYSIEADRVETESKKKIWCQATVLATNSPMNHNLAVHARQLPYRTFAIGVLCPKTAFCRADYWSTEEPYHYIRADDYDDENFLIIVGGEDHKTGHNPSYDVYAALEKHARGMWPALGEVILRWNGQVMEPADLLYLHGRDPLVADNHNRFIITGDSGQGMTGGTIGARIVTDLIMGRSTNPWADVYSPSRKPPLKSLIEIAEEGAVTTASFAERVLPKITLSYELERGTGAVVQKGVHKVALFRDQAGKDHAMSAVCPHMGCLVHWNTVEKTWDCPCHGSHFDSCGKVINGPAKADLAKVDW